MDRPGEPSPERVLVLTPTGRDAAMVEERLAAAGFACEVCRDLEALLLSLRGGAGAALIAEEALGDGGPEALLAALGTQEPWSDLPLVVLTFALSRRFPRAPAIVGLLGRANVMLLPRPVPSHLLLGAVRSAVRARRRQYEMRDLHRELARAVQLSELFVGILGHDLRTPLGAIRMSAEAILRGADDPRSLRAAGRILSSSDRMTRMIEQLLDVARVRQGSGIRVQVVPADLGEIARQVLQELRDASPEARLQVFPSGDLAGRWDPDRLAQVISNVVGNAIQHGTPGQPVTVALDGTARESVRLAVGNLGAIPEGALPTLFEPFKPSGPTRRGEKGLGLGLFIAREIVRAHGGDIGVRVADGRTLLEATLPRHAPPA